MPDLSERQVAVGDGNVVAPTQIQAMHPPITPMEPVGTGFMRSPLPPVWSSNPDSIRYFYRNGVPQLRILSPALKN